MEGTFKELDADGNGTLSFEELLPLLKQAMIDAGLQEQANNQELFKLAFKELDLDG